MRKRIFNWQGQSFVYLGLEGAAGGSTEEQAQSLFARADAELKTHRLSLERNVVRTRVFGRTREARDIVSAVRGKVFAGTSRAASSSFISPPHFDSAADVALDLYAMSPPDTRSRRDVTEHEPPQPFIRHLVWGPMVFLAGMTCEQYPTLQQQCQDILPRAGKLLRETDCDWANVVGVSLFLQKDQSPDALLADLNKAAPIPLDCAEIELVEGYSRPGKLIEIEITAKRWQ
jgi:enamine deaminase RidA (YjgF/YER057c/UK114 family)